jgi:hypothetical protein
MILFRMSKEPVRQTYSTVGQIPQYTGYNVPVINNPTMQQSYGGYPTTQYVPAATIQHPGHAVVADGMVSWGDVFSKRFKRGGPV